MPKAFSANERALIHTQLLAHGRELLAAHGMRRVNVEDLTTAVGISKGAFYLFFDSKEALVFAVIQQFEAEYRTRLLQSLGPPDQPAGLRLRAFLRYAMAAWRSEPLFRRFGREEYAIIARRLPPEVLAEAMQDDQDFAGQLVAHWAAEGIHVTVSAELLSGLLRALFFVGLHADELSSDAAQAVIDRLIDAVANDLLAGA